MFLMFAFFLQEAEELERKIAEMEALALRGP